MMMENKKIICLGKEFTSEEKRREYYRNELRTKLPELKKIEGFPIGEDEDIINLSDPPYYTACPNPWLNDFIAEWEKEKKNVKGRKEDFHVDEPYASDVSEGKNNPIYNAHSYHTKVPHPAIMRYILHYTQPGDIVFDGFSGTGMTGVATQNCEDPDGETRYLIENEFKLAGADTPLWGRRNALLSDLSPVASFISHNYNTPVDIEEFIDYSKLIINDFETEYGWMYETIHLKDKIGKTNYTVYSDVISCPNCLSEFTFYEVALDKELGSVLESFNCPNCNAALTKKNSIKIKETIFDELLNQAIQIQKTKPVLINYTYNNKVYNKKPEKFDLELEDKINNTKLKYWVPIQRMIDGGESRRNDSSGITHVHHFYTKRALLSLSKLYESGFKYLSTGDSHALFLVEQLVLGMAKISRYVPTHFSQVNQYLSGTLYIGSQVVDVTPNYILKGKLSRLPKAFRLIKSRNVNSLQSATDFSQIKDQTIDYIFTDPPFGANLMYSELNCLHEFWLRLITNIKSEAIENRSLNKTLLDYQNLMTSCFEEYNRVLKPGKWMTVEFSNTSAAVWNGIQTSLQRAGFVIANVAGLDKKQGSFKAVTTPTAVKQDLVISCYKPSSEFENKFKTLQGEIAVWDFISEHLLHLPTHLKKDNSTTAIIERSPKIIFDRLITFYLMRSLPVPIDARDFQEGLKQRFVERDGMYFTAEQAAEYDEKKSHSPQFVQLSLIVTNESDAIEWLKDRLRRNTQKYQDIMPEFRIATQSLRKGDTLPELQNILNESFIQDANGKWGTPNPNEAKDRDALRNKVLLKEFNGYVAAIGQPKAKKLKEVRVEALRAGFKYCWEQKNFKTIVTIGDMIPQNILLEDEQLLMYFDIAKDRV
jgi:DNA modification methylase